MTDLADLTVSRQRAVIAVIDVQERLFAVMPEEARDLLERNVVVLLEAARRFAIPVVVSEQYPRGLGPTVPRIAAALEAVPDVRRIEKLDFALTDAPGFDALGRDQWIVAGMECHICVWQTVRGLRRRGLAVHVLTDAVTSRTHANQQVGLDLARGAGAILTSTETVVFDLLGRAGSDDFKALSKLIK